MKIYNPLPCLILIILMMANTGCEKDPIVSRSGNPPPNTPNTPNTPDTSNTPNTPDTSNTPNAPDNSAAGNRPPMAHAGGDLMVDLRVNEAFMGGSCSSWENNIKGFSWTKISGPDSYTLENKNDLGTKLYGMEKGIYQFELTVTDSKGLYDKDTMMVIVGEMSANPEAVIFKDLVVVCPWYCGVGITNIYSHLSAGSVFKVYVQRDNSASWEEAVPELQWTENDSYWFDLNDGNLEISGFGWEDKPTIKIIY